MGMNPVPLYERGVRPDPKMRGPIAAWLYEQTDREYRRFAPWLAAVIAHEMMWGVPCGPTLSMLPGHGPKGIRALVDSLNAAPSPWPAVEGTGTLTEDMLRAASLTNYRPAPPYLVHPRHLRYFGP